MAAGATTHIETEYLMTIYGPLEPPLQIDAGLVIFNVGPGGWVRGPRINGVAIPPSADWLHILPSGVRRQDVRLTVKTDDNALIYVTYNGVLVHNEETAERARRGELLTSRELFSSTAPTFRTSNEKYAWLNSVQAISRLIELKPGQQGSYIKFDVFAVK